MLVPMTTDRKARHIAWRFACVGYALATAVWAIGIERAAARYPGSYDWTYTVISALASRKHNPEGAAWFAGWLFTIGYLHLNFWYGLLGLLVWPYFIGSHLASLPS